VLAQFDYPTTEFLMTKLPAADSGRSVVVRWRMLAERRLKYLIELYESGRWKLYYNEPEFLKIVREAHAALKAWETLAPPEPGKDRQVEVEAARSAERPSIEPRPVSAPPMTVAPMTARPMTEAPMTVAPTAAPLMTPPPLATPSFARPSLAMQALRSSSYGIGTQYDLGKS
jgi:uncharacterized repeat protein (TIGR03809 family)